MKENKRKESRDPEKVQQEMILFYYNVFLDSSVEYFTEMSK